MYEMGQRMLEKSERPDAAARLTALTEGGRPQTGVHRRAPPLDRQPRKPLPQTLCDCPLHPTVRGETQ